MLNWLKKLFTREPLPLWLPGVIAYATRDGGLIVLDSDSGTNHPYVRTSLVPGRIVYTGCRVWVNRDTGMVTTRESDTKLS